MTEEVSKENKFNRGYTGVVAAVALAVGFCGTELLSGTTQKAVLYFGPLLSSIIGYFIYVFLEILSLPRANEVRSSVVDLKMSISIRLQCITLSAEDKKVVMDAYKNRKLQRILTQIQDTPTNKIDTQLEQNN